MVSAEKHFNLKIFFSTDHDEDVNTCEKYVVYYFLAHQGKPDKKELHI